jgi:lytic cellulose monooxygenase (C1-hydroxylating)
VADATKADGSSGQWFKIFENGWSAKGSVGDDNNWGTKDLNSCCGKMDVKIPKALPDGDYLLRAEALALHTAGSSGGAQFYVSCYQVTMSGGNGTLPTSGLVKFPGAYKASDPGILVNIHAALKGNYVVPGPPVIPGGTTKVAGSGCEGCAKTCTAGAGSAAKATTKGNQKNSQSW